MYDKFRLTDNPRNWRIRNKVDVPHEYLDVLTITNYRLAFLTGCLFIWCFILGYSFNV